MLCGRKGRKRRREPGIKRHRVYYEPSAIRYTLEEAGETVLEQRTEFPETENRTEYKNHLKRLVYRCLSEYTGQKLPWGDLTGIRPVKIPLRLLEEGRTNGEDRGLSAGYLLCKPGKDGSGRCHRQPGAGAALRHGLASGYSLYVGVPFCPTICLYCSFGSHPLKQWGYLMGAYLGGSEKGTVLYRGADAGTASAHHLHRGRDPHHPFTGAAPGTAGLSGGDLSPGSPPGIYRGSGAAGHHYPEKLQVLREFPVSRISINPQTMNQKTLDLIGRKHTVEETEAAYVLARELGFDNINMDLIVGLPGEGKQEVAHTLEEMKRLRPDSLTIHSLALKRATRLNLFKDQYAEISF